MSKAREMDVQRVATPVAAPASNMLGGAVLVGLAIAIVLGALSLINVRKMGTELTARLNELDAKVAKIQTAPAAAAKPPQRGPDPSKVHTIQTTGSPAKGPAAAPVVITEFSDFQCPFCSRGAATMDQVAKVYGDKVRVVWKHMPLAMHPDAPLAHMASMAANEQGKFWAYHDKLFKSQGKLKADDLKRYAQEVGLDVARFEQALTAAKFKPQIDADVAEAGRLGVTGTPGFFVNGKFVGGAKPFEEFAKAINAELTRMNIALPPDAPKV